jgi:hypothetical protein
MIDAALYLSRRTLVNSLRRRLERLRQPKYLIGFAVGLLYFYWLVAQPGGPGAGRVRGGGFPAGAPALGDVFAVAGLAALMLLTWVFGRAETPLTFQLAETDFLFPAPLTRRQVIQFRLLRSQIPLFISAAFSVLLFSQGRFTAMLPLRVAALWLLYFTLQLHYAGAALVRGSLTQQGVTGLRRRLLTLGVIGAVLGVLWWGLRAMLPEIVAAWRENAAGGAAALDRALHQGALGVVLWPLFAMKGPLLAATATQFVTRLPAALVVALAHYVWVVRSTLAFEEAAVAHADRVARRIEAMRRGRAAAPRTRPGGAPRALVPLAAAGAPATAILWKNVVGALREFRLRTLVLLAVLVTALATALGGGGRGGGSGTVGATADLVAVLALTLTALVILFGPLALRHDLRRDLELLDVLKTYPLTGRELVGAEVLAPAALLSGVAALGCAIAFAAAAVSPTPPGSLPDRAAMLVAALALAPPVITVLLLAQNAAALLFPAWTTIGPPSERSTGFEAMGQRILMFAGTGLALLVAVVPAAVAGAVVAIGARGLGVGPAWAGAVWAVAGAAVLGAECVLVIRLLDPVWERLEPAALR